MRFTVEWLPDSGDGLILAANVYVTSGAILRRHIGDVHFNGTEWMFICRDRDGKQMMDGVHYIPVDPDTEAHFRTELAKLTAGEDTPDAFVAELNIQRRQHRDSSLELAELGAKMEARKWWRNGYGSSSRAADADERTVLAEAHRQEKRDTSHVAETEFPCGHRFPGAVEAPCPYCHDRRCGVCGIDIHLYPIGRYICDACDARAPQPEVL